VSFPKLHYNDMTDLLPTCVCHVANKSVTSWQLSRLRGSYGEMDFGQQQAHETRSVSYGQPMDAATVASGGQKSWPPSRKYCHIKVPTLSIDAYLLEEHSCQISSRFNDTKEPWAILKSVTPT